MKRTGWRKPKKRRRKPKTPQWTTTRADTTFSLYIRERDGCCKSCGTTERLTCSHYWRRGHSSTRYDPLNCIALCVDCHSIWENTKNREYKDFMLDWLGEEQYLVLEHRARTFMKRDEAVEEWRRLYQQLRSCNSVLVY